jgi:hypothetical protein
MSKIKLLSCLVNFEYQKELEMSRKWQSGKLDYPELLEQHKIVSRTMKEFKKAKMEVVCE